MVSCPPSAAILLAVEAMLAKLKIEVPDDKFFAEPLNSDAKKIDTIDTLTDTFNAVQQAVVDVLRTRVANLGKHRNSLSGTSPLDRLPIELFQNIISRSLDGATVPLRLVTLRTVSTTWAQRLLACPSLWATIVVPSNRRTEGSTRLVEQLLELSGNSPLTVVAIGSEDQAPALQILARHTYRWKYLYVDHPYHARAHLTSPAPLLEELALEPKFSDHIDIGQPDAGFKSLFGGSAPRLRKIRSSHLPVLLEANPQILKNVVDLALIVYGSGPSPVILGQVEEIVARCLALKSLEIGFHDHWLRQSQIRLDNPIFLPSVRQLRLTTTSGLVASVLHNIRAPHCTSYCIQEGFQGRGRLDVTISTPQTQETFREISRIFDGAGDVTARVTRRQNHSGGEVCTFSCAGSGTTVELQELDHTLEILAKGYSAMRVKRLELHLVHGEGCTLWAMQLADVRLPVEEIAVEGEIGLRDLQELLSAHGSHPWAQAVPLAPLCRLETWNGEGWVDRLQEVKDYATSHNDTT